VLFRSVGAGLLPEPVEGELHDLGERVASVAIALGYRGWLGIDCLLTVSGELLVTEINARRTGGMHSIGLLKLRNELRTEVAHSNDTLALPLGSDWSYDKIRPVFHRLWETGCSIYPTTVRNLSRSRPTLGVLSAGANAEDAVRIAEQFGVQIARAGG